MFSLAAGRNMQIGLVPQYARSLHRIVLIVLRQLLQGIVGFLIHQVALLDPSLGASPGAHARKTFFVIEHFDALSVLHRAHAVVDRGDLIAQGGLWCGNVGDLEHAVAVPIARREHQAGSKERNYSQPARLTWENWFHEAVAYLPL